MKRKKHITGIGRKILTMFLAFAIVLSGLPNAAFSGITKADAASVTGISGSLESKKLKDYEFKSNRYMQIWLVDYAAKKVSPNGSCTEANSPMQVYSINTGKGVDPIVFCVEHGVTQKNTTNMNARAREVAEMTQAYRSEDMYYAIENIFKVLFYGPVKRSASELSELGFQPGNKYYGQHGTDYTFAAWVAATQCLIWECQQDFRDENFNRTANGLYYQNGWHGDKTSKISADHYTNNIKGTPAMDIYNFMASEIKKNMKFDKSVASLEKSKPTEISIPEDATFPYTKELSGTGNGDDLEVVDSNDKVVKGISIKFNADTKTYTLKVDSKDLLNKTLSVRHKGAAAQRAEKYTKGSDSKYYKPLFWGYATNGGTVHTQGFVSGLDDPTRGYLKLTTTPPPTSTEPGSCEPLDVDVFPIINMPIEKVDANTGFDGNNHTPMGDAKLDAVATLERQMDGGAWQTIDTKQFDELGSEMVFSDQPFLSKDDLDAYLTESGILTNCDHPITDSEGNIIGYEHNGSKQPTKREWDVTVNYRITITRPDGRYIDPDQYGGVREYTMKYHAETEDTCTAWCHSDPWTPVQYDISWGATTGDGSMHNLQDTSVTDGGTIENEPELDCDLETDVEDLFRGSILIVKSNEKENPFKDSTLGGSDSNMSKKTLWTIKLKSKGLEGEEYIHLKSMTPKKGTGGTNIYTVSREPGIRNDENNPMTVGTNGQLMVTDLPYGEYIVTEVSADDPMYVLEQFTVVVAEHNGDGDSNTRIAYEAQGSVPLTGKWTGYNKTGDNQGISVSGTGDFYNNLYQVNLRDKIKSNQIKLEKRDSETGKIVRLAGTKVFIRYKGNPDYTDEENREKFGPTGTVAKNIYNRFLPNSEAINSTSTNYTFELDENGCLDIPYQLPYGKYEIYEWLLPNGYYVGEYGADGVAKNHNFGLIEEGQFTVEQNTHGYQGTVPDYAIKDADGNPIKYQDKEKYSFEDLKKMVTNRYTFTVTKQNMHTDGNFSELVTYTGHREDADPAYDKGDYPYTNYYKVAAVINNAVKGKITIEKEGEELTGFKKETKDGRTIFTPIYEMGAKLKDAVFGIFAAEDINLSDGSDGPKIYDSATREEITIPKTKDTHFNNVVETVKAFFGKLLNPKEYSAAKYETGELSHSSGAELWYMLEREASEGNLKRTIYVTPEQKDTVYSYAFETTDDLYRYRYDVTVTMKNQAGGTNITDVHVSKVTSTLNGYAVDIPLTKMTGSVGDKVLDPLESYLNVPTGSDATSVDPNLISALDVYNETYTFQANGDYNYNWNAEATDFSNIGAKRYVVKNYHYYKLTEDDLKDVEKKVGETPKIAVPGEDLDGDGVIDPSKGDKAPKYVIKEPGEDLDGDGVIDPSKGDKAPVYEMEDIMETRKAIEWENDGWMLVGNPSKGERAVFVKVQEDATAEKEYKAAVLGYDAALSEADMENEESAGTVKYTSLISNDEDYAFLTSDEAGDEIKNYTLPEGYSELAFDGNPEVDARYVIATRTDAETGETTYKVLLSDETTWQDCTVKGNFQKAVVQVYEVKYTQRAGDPDGFTLSWDTFAIGSNVDQETNTATTVITKNAQNVANETFDVGAGYTYENAGDTATFTTIPITAPVYFEWADGVKADMYYKGGVAYATIEMPQSAVDYLYEDIVPTLSFNYTDAEGKAGCLNLDWYSKLTPENPEVKFSVVQGLPEGCTVKATRKDSLATGEETTYYIEIVTNQKEDKPLQLKFADGYVMDVYCADAASGNGVGVIDLHNVYKTTRYTKGELVETITTNDAGKAESKLLPLGKYVVKELNAPNGYVTDGTSYEVDLAYKDQFTPLVWKGLNLKNEYFTVEIDMEKVFETAYQSKTYQPSSGATFGLYNAADLAGSGSNTELAASIPADTLMDVITVDENGKAKSKMKLPYGTYYIKELATKNGYVLNDMPFYFVVGEDGSTTSEPCSIGYDANGKIIAEDGVASKVVLNSYGNATITVETQVRYPMPKVTVDGVEYALTEDKTVEGIKITAKKDVSKVEIEAKDGQEHKVTLPNGKELTVKVTGNTYTYHYDGTEHQFVPKTSYTGYAGKYESTFDAPKGEDLNVKMQTITVSEAGADPNKAVITVIHTPVTKEVIVTPAVPAKDLDGDGIIDPAKGDIAEVPAVTKTVGILNTEGYQTYTHTAKAEYQTAGGASAIAGDILRTRDNKTTSETPEGEIGMIAGDSIALKSTTGANVTLMLDKSGLFRTMISNTANGKLEEADAVKASLDGADKTADVTFVKSVTQARQDHAAKSLQIKVNTLDNLNASGITNDAVKPDTPPTTPPTPGSSTPAIRTVAKDSKTNDHISLAGKDATIIDTVYFYNLTVGQEYKLVGKLMDKETGKPVLIGGKEVTAETTFKPAVSTGTQNISFTFDARSLKGKDVVVFETLYKIVTDKDGKVTEEKTASHEDINDGGQTITFPEIHTTATGENGEKTIEAKGRVTIIDIVEYQNLIAGKTYTMKGYLVDKKTEKAIYENGEKVTSEVTFTAESESGTVEMVFTVNAKALSGKSVVVFEDCYFEDVKVAAHADINDKGQTVKFKAKDGRIEFDTERDEDEDDDIDIVPKTGDRMQLQLMLLLMLASMFGLFAAVRIRRKE